jgi:hypothetical protein
VKIRLVSLISFGFAIVLLAGSPVQAGILGDLLGYVTGDYYSGAANQPRSQDAYRANYGPGGYSVGQRAYSNGPYGPTAYPAQAARYGTNGHTVRYVPPQNQQPTTQTRYAANYPQLPRTAYRGGRQPRQVAYSSPTRSRTRAVSTPSWTGYTNPHYYQPRYGSYGYGNSYRGYCVGST